MRDVDAGSCKFEQSGTTHKEFRAELNTLGFFGFSFEQHIGIAVAAST
jgi:hypothetical protein